MDTKDNPSFSSIDPDMDIMSIDEFKQLVLFGALIDDDGVGRWATETTVSDQCVSPSDMFNSIQPPGWASHVVWFNK